MLRAAIRFGSPTCIRAARATTIALATLAAAGCSTLGDSMPNLLASNASGAESKAAEAPLAQDELQKATEYWGNQYRQKPTELEPALSYARNLKAMGQKGEALAVLQQASMYHTNDKKLASEYGRLALELDQVSAASQLLAIADDPAQPDWRVLSARGTVLAKQGKYAEAIPYYERALKLSEGRSSILNNLALAHAMSGEAPKAEELLRKAVSAEGSQAKTRQNLALVLGLQGKYDEATRIASADIPPLAAAANTALVRQMVKLEPKVLPQGVIQAQPVAVAAPALPNLKPALADNVQPAVTGWKTQVAAAGAAPAIATTWSAGTTASERP